MSRSQSLPLAELERKRNLLEELQRKRAQLRELEAEEWGAYRDDPVRFVQNVLGESPWAVQQEILGSLFTPPRRTVVKSCFASGKCALYNEPMQLADGSVVQMSDLVGRSFHVLGWRPNGTQTVRRAKAEWNAWEPVYRLTTDGGRAVTRNAAHPFWAAESMRAQRIRREGRTTTGLTPKPYGWTPISDLEPGRDLVLVPELVETVGDGRLPDGHAAMLGYLLGDGGTTTSSITFAQLPGPALDEFEALAEKLGCQIGRRVKREGRRHEELCVSRGSNGNEILGLARRYGIYGKRSGEKRIANEIWRCGIDEIATVAGRLFSCDGFVDVRSGNNKRAGRGQVRLVLALHNEGLVRDFQRMMLRLGIPGTVRCVHKTHKGQPYPVWEWHVGGAREIKRFAEVIDAPAKNEKLALAVEMASERGWEHGWRHREAPSGYRWERVRSVELLPPNQTVAIEVEHDHAWVDMFVEHNTWIAARAVAHWCGTDPNAIAITTATVGRQVAGQLWGELRGLIQSQRIPGQLDTEGWDAPGEILPRAPQWHISPQNFALGFSTREPAAFSGWHGGRVLVVLEEAEGIPEAIWDQMEGQMASADVAVLALGNPMEPTGGFYKACRSSMWSCITISAFDTPNLVSGRDDVMPSLVTNRWVRERQEDWGEDHPLYISKVLAQFPEQGTMKVVPLIWFERAIDSTKLVSIDESPECGLDIARFGKDDSALAIMQGPEVLHLERIHGADGPNVAGWALDRMSRYGCKTVKGDATGLGGPVLDIMRRAPGISVEDVHAGSRPRDPAKFVRRRDELWWGVRIVFENELIRFSSRSLSSLELAKLKEQVTEPRYRYDAAGRIEVESKDDLATRKVSSPDLADALCLAKTPSSGPAWSGMSVLRGRTV